jgi:hypothetical protein
MRRVLKCYKDMQRRNLVIWGWSWAGYLGSTLGAKPWRTKRTNTRKKGRSVSRERAWAADLCFIQHTSLLWSSSDLGRRQDCLLTWIQKLKPTVISLFYWRWRVLYLWCVPYGPIWSLSQDLMSCLTVVGQSHQAAWTLRPWL